MLKKHQLTDSLNSVDRHDMFYYCSRTSVPMCLVNDKRVKALACVRARVCVGHLCFNGTIINNPTSFLSELIYICNATISVMHNMSHFRFLTKLCSC